MHFYHAPHLRIANRKAKMNLSRLFFSIALAICLANFSYADIIAGYDFTTDANATQTISGASATSFGGGVTGFGIENSVTGDTTGVAASGTSFGSTARGSFGKTNGGLKTGSLGAAITDNDFLTFTLTADVPGTLNVSGSVSYTHLTLPTKA